MKTADVNIKDAIQNLIVKSPLTGHLFPIEEIPDPVFSQKMVGDGISIDPLDQLLVAPIDGVITQIHSAHHAVTITSPQGIEVLMHIGIDSVKLKGNGFKTKVKVGDQVQAGDLLIEFDADYVATNAKSLLTQILITNGEQKTIIKPRSGKVRAGEDVILEVELNKSFAEKHSGEKSSVKKIQPLTAEISSETINIVNPTGLHARPAAVLAGLAKKFTSNIRIQRGQGQANAKSLVAIMGLEISCGDQVILTAEGVDAEEALKLLTLNLKEGLGEKAEVAPPSMNLHTKLTAEANQFEQNTEDSRIFKGVPSSQGLVVGNVFQIRHEEILVEEFAANPEQELQKLSKSLSQAKVQLEALKNQLDSQSKSDKGAIFAAHQELLEDPDLLEITMKEIEQSKTAAFAWKKAYGIHADRLAKLSNELLAARANDLRDVGRRVLLLLVENTKSEPTENKNSDIKNTEVPTNAILIAENLTPSDTASLDRSKVLGFCTTTGGASSHVAILARSLGIPAIAGIDPRALEIPSGTPVVLDGTKGLLQLNPNPEDMQRIQKLQDEIEKKRQVDLSKAHDRSATLDGHHVEVFANIGGLADAQQAMTLGGEGVGLLRSEFLFLKRSLAPSENEQHRVYQDIAHALESKHPLTIRTLDIGGDKPLPYLPIPPEENPFLGERGIRVSFSHPEIFRTQLRAILRAAENDQMRIMFPMISTIQEWRQAKAILEEERQKLGIAPVAAGIMIEVPAAAILAEAFAKEVDFFSIGTNDLTQYTLAMDRGHAKLASQTDGLHPSVLRLIDMTVKAAHRHKKWVGICGGIASDLEAVPILLGLGVDELSVSVPAIPGIKAQIRRLRLSSCQELATRALEQTTAAEVRALVTNYLP